ncbi:hypothetical protein QQ045_032368 [Rhodiola kirilowii]
MVMVTDKDGTVDRNDDSKSPWRKPPINIDSPVMGAAASWPALSEARDRDAPLPPPPPPPPSLRQQPPPPDSKGSNGAAHRNPHNRHHKPVHKRGTPQTHAPRPFNEPRLPHPMMPPMPMPGPIPVPPYHYPPAPFPPVVPHGGGKAQVKPFVPPPPTIDRAPVRTPFVPPPPTIDRAPVRTPLVQDPAFPPRMWHHQRSFYPVGPQGFVRPYFAQPGFMVGPRIPGAPPMYFLPAPPPGSVMVARPPHNMQRPTTPVSPEKTPEEPDLKTRILKQIEYYFSDENLEGDKFLINLMDGEGWVPVSKISEFNRIRRMKVEISTIQDALESSKVLEVQNDKIRKRVGWLKWIPHRDSGLCSKAETDEQHQLQNVNGVPETNEVSHDDARETVEGTLHGLEADHDDSHQTFSEENSKGNDLQTTKYTYFAKHNAEGNEMLSADFSSAFMMDEEIEYEQETGKSFASSKRIDNDEEDTPSTVDIEKLVIVTQTGRTSRVSGSYSRGVNVISSEHASAIDEGLYFYEQELNTQPSNHRKSKFDTATREQRCQPLAPDVGSPHSRHESVFVEESANSSSKSRRKHNKTPSKLQYSQKQRFFNNFRSQGSGRNSPGGISESPPSNSVGFYFGSTPPDSHSIRSSRLSSSPHGNLACSSPPVGSLPKSVPPFQHPSHQLLEENGFKQQKYQKYRKRCLNDRKKLGTGCSEEDGKRW